MLAVLDQIPWALRLFNPLEDSPPLAPDLPEARSSWNELLRSYESGITQLAVIYTYEIYIRIGITPLSGELLTSRCVMTHGP